MSSTTEPPDCGAVPLTNSSGGTFVADCIYLHLWIENIGKVTAKNAEVYAAEVRRKRADGKGQRVNTFFPMNLKWANLGRIYFPISLLKWVNIATLGTSLIRPDDTLCRTKTHRTRSQ